MNVKTLLCITAIGSMTACSHSVASPHFNSAPELSPNPNERAPLVALLDFDAPDAVRTVVTLDDGNRQWDIEFDGTPGDEPLPIIGMRAGKRHRFTVTIFDADNNATPWDGELFFQTPPLPTDRYVMPHYAVRVADEDRMEPGITVLSLRRALSVRPQDRTKGQQAFVEGYGLLLAIDNEGEVVWFYQSDDRIAGIDRLANGNLLYHMASFTAVEMDWLGNVVRSWTPENKPEGIPRYEDSIAIKGIQTLHHQPHEVRDGTFLSFSANWRVIKNWYTNEFDPEPRKDQKVMGDTIIEFNKDGNMLWEWNAFDHLDTDMIGYETFNPYWVTRRFPDTWDWTHGNGVSYDARDDSVIASFKLLDAIIKIDRKSGDIKWIFGDHHGWKGELREKLLTPVGDDFRWPWHQHNPRWTHAGTLLVFNNNRGQAKPFDGRPHAAFNDTWSYSVEYDIDEDAMTVSQAWISEPEITADSCNSMAMSESHRLPKTDNILEINALCQKSDTPNVTWDIWDRTKRYLSEIPHGGRVREFTRTSPAEIVFDVSFRDPHDVLNWQVYGGFRMASFYESPTAH